MRIFCAECAKEFEVPIYVPETVEFVCSDCIMEMVDLYNEEEMSDEKERSDLRVLH